MISTSFIAGTGFMKCIPMTRSAREVLAPILVMEIDDVFEAKIVSGGQNLSSFCSSAIFASSFSITASITKPTLPRSSRLVVVSTRRITRSRSSGLKRPRSIMRSRLRAIVSTPRLHIPGGISCITTAISACAATCAIPAPICPAPITPICCKLIRLSEKLSGPELEVRDIILERAKQRRDVSLVAKVAAQDFVVTLDTPALLILRRLGEHRLEIFENRLRFEFLLYRNRFVIPRNQQPDVIDHPVHHGKVAAIFFHRRLMMIGRILAADPRARAAAAAHRGAHLHHVFGRLTPRHPEVAHQDVGHIRSQPVANRRRVADLRVEHPVNLLARETLSHENIDQPGQADFTAGAVHDRHHFGAWRANAPDKPCPLAAINASHQEIDRLEKNKSRKKLEAAVRTKNRRARFISEATTGFRRSQVLVSEVSSNGFDIVNLRD